jgi:DNA-binding transcriptional ArsR family regulator
VDETEARALRAENEQLKSRLRDLEDELHAMRTVRPLRDERLVPRQPLPDVKPSASVNGVDLDALYAAIKLKALADPEDAKVLAVLRRVPEIEVTKTIERIKLDGKTQPGVLAGMIAEGYFDQPVEMAAVVAELKRRGRGVHNANVSRDLNRLSELGFLTNETAGYQAVPGMKINIVEASA